MSSQHIRFIDTRVLHRHSLRGEKLAAESHQYINSLPDVKDRSLPLQIPTDPIETLEDFQPTDQ